MIDQRLDAREKAYRVRQLRVRFERRLVDPARVDPEQPRVTRRAVRGDREATGLLARRRDDVAYCRFDVLLASVARVKTAEDCKLAHRTRLRLIDALRQAHFVELRTPQREYLRRCLFDPESQRAIEVDRAPVLR